MDTEEGPGISECEPQRGVHAHHARRHPRVVRPCLHHELVELDGLD